MSENCKLLYRQVLAGILLAFVILSAGCDGQEKNSAGRISRAADLNNKKMVIAGETGSFALTVAKKTFPQATLKKFDYCADIFPALAAGKVDAIVFDRPALEFATLSHPDFVILPENLANGMICVAAPVKNGELIRKVNEFIRQYRSNGTYQEMFKRWVRTKNPVMPEISAAKKPDGILKIGVDSANAPMAFWDKEKRLAGFDIEFARRLALHLNAKCELKVMNYDALLSACTQGTIDLAVANMDATEERGRKVLFSDIYLDSPIAAMIRRQDFADPAARDNKLFGLNAPDKKIGVPEGAAAMTVGEKVFNRAKILYFSSLSEGYTAVRYKKIDAFVFDRHNMSYAVKTGKDLKLLPENIAEEHIVIGVAKRHPELLEKLNQFIREYRRNGVYKDMYARWFDTTDHRMPDITPPASPAMKFRVGTEGLNEPMNYFGKDGKVTGFDVEFIKRLEQFLNAKIEIETMTYPALLAATETGKLDFMVANLNKTPERAQSILMSDDYVDSAIAVMVHSDFVTESSSPQEINTLKDLQGRKAACLTGSGFQELTEPLQKGISYVHFNDNHSSVMALRTGKVDAVLLDKPIAQLFAARFPDELRVVCVYAKDYYGYAFNKNSSLTDQASRVISQLKKSGEMAKLTAKWCEGDMAQKKLAVWTHKKDFTGKNGTLRFGSDMTQEPMCYADENGAPIGLDVEITRRIAYELDMKFEFVAMNFSSLIEALIAKRVDAVGGSMSITEERKKRVDFAECYYEGGLTILGRGKKSSPVASGHAITDISQLDGKNVGVFTGTVMDQLARQHCPKAIPVYFNTFNDMVAALKIGKITAFLMEEPQFRLLQLQMPELKKLDKMLSFDDYAFVFTKDDQKLCDAFSGEINKMKADGTLKKLQEKWFSADNSVKKMPEITNHAPNGVLKFATVPQFEPFTYIRDGNVVGYDIEVARLAAAKLGYKLETSIMEWGGFLEAIAAGKVRIGIGCVTVTEERKQKVRFAAPTYKGGITIVCMDNAAPGSVSDAETLVYLRNKRIGIMTGSTFDFYSKKVFSNGEISYLDSYSDLAMNLNQNKIDAFLMDEPMARIMLKSHPNLRMIPLKDYVEKYAIALGKNTKNEKLRSQLNEFILNCQKDGLLKQLDSVWFGDDEKLKNVIPQDKLPATNGTLRLAVKPLYEPFCYIKKQHLAGYDIDMLTRFCQKYGYALQTDTFSSSSAVVAAIASGKFDIGCGCITVTDERKEAVNFSEPNYLGGVVAVVRKKMTLTEPELSFWTKTAKSLQESFDRTFLRESRWKLIGEGLQVTVVITVLAALLGTILAFPVCFLRRSQHYFPRLLGRMFISLMQGTPILVILMILYYVVFAKIDIDSVIVAVIGFGLNFAAYAGEMLRTGIDAVPRGQREASLALGFSGVKTFCKVILPQALRQILPVYRGEFINMLKTTSIVGYIAIQDLTKMSDIIRSRTYEAFFPLIATAVIYFATAWILALGLTFLEHRLDPLSRRKSGKKEMR